MLYRASQSRVLTRQSPFTTRVKRIVISVYLNFVSYLISYTRLFTKLNLFKILLYVTFLTTKFSRSTVTVEWIVSWIACYFQYFCTSVANTTSSSIGVESGGWWGITKWQTMTVVKLKTAKWHQLMSLSAPNITQSS